MKRKFLSIILTCIVSATLIQAVKAAEEFSFFSDIETHWAKVQIVYLADKGILNGYEDGTFKPDGIVTRAEFIKMMTETFELTDMTELNYSDVSLSDWFYTYISKAAAQGFLPDYGDNINPNEKLSREEAASLLARYFNLDEMADISFYPDYDEITPEFVPDVLKATSAGLFGGYEDGTFRHQNTLTRAEALTILYRTYDEISSYDNSENNEENTDKEKVFVQKDGINDSEIWTLAVPDQTPPAADEPVSVAQDFYIELTRTVDGEYEIKDQYGSIIYTNDFKITAAGFSFSYSQWKIFNINFIEDFLINGISKWYGGTVENPESAIKYLNEVMKVYINGETVNLSEMTRFQGNGHIDYDISFENPVSLDTFESISIKLGNP